MKEEKTFKNCAVYAWSKLTDSGTRYIVDVKILNRVYNIAKKDDYKKAEKLYDKLTTIVKNIDEMLMDINNVLSKYNVGQIWKIIKAHKPTFIVKTQYGILFMTIDGKAELGPKIPEKIKENVQHAMKSINELLGTKYKKAATDLFHIVGGPCGVDIFV